MKKDKIKIVNEKTEKKVVEEKITTEILAKSIRDLAEGYKRLMAAGLTKYAIVVLLHGITPSIGKKEIETILNSMEQLEAYYLRGKR
jgi:hypothetical protein